jgi:hypothetical protein
MPRVLPSVDAKPSHPQLSPSFVETVAGFTAGVAATLVVHPFDILKTRLQRKSTMPHREGSGKVGRWEGGKVGSGKAEVACMAGSCRDGQSDASFLNS